MWKTKEVFEKFGEEKIGPMTAQVGLSEPKMTFFEMHSYLTAG